jgi:flagellar motor switch protein FliN/FliY
MATITPGTPPYILVESLRQATSDRFSQTMGANWTVEIDASAVLPPGEDTVLCFQLSTSGELEGNAFIKIGTTDAIYLAQKLLAEPVDPSAELNQDRKEALRKLLGQVANQAANSLGIRFGEAKIEVEVSAIEPPLSQGTSIAMLAAEASSKVTMYLELSPELLASLASAETAAPAPVASAKEYIDVAPHEPNLGLLLGVNLSLTLRFGQRVLPLREVLDLNAGAIVELDREVREPADLLLGDKVIARGEVVLVDGNYGLRITEVADARQRIGTL